MIDIQVRYQASAFVKTPELVPTTAIISLLLDLFSDKQLLPSVIQEMTPSPTGTGLQAMPRVRLTGIPPRNDWSIVIASNRIDVEKTTLTSKGDNLGDIAVFSEEAIELMSRLLTKFNKKANRLAIVSTGFLKEMTEEQLANVYAKLAKPIPYYSDRPPHEWNIRNVSKNEPIAIGTLSERINTITSVNRVHGQMFEPTHAANFDRIEVSFDINTEAEIEDARFFTEELPDFFGKALQIRSEIINQLEVLIYD